MDMKMETAVQGLENTPNFSESSTQPLKTNHSCSNFETCHTYICLESMGSLLVVDLMKVLDLRNLTASELT